MTITLSCLPIGIAAAAFGAAVVRKKSRVLCPALGPLPEVAAGVLLFEARPFAAGFAAAEADLRFAGCFYRYTTAYVASWPRPIRMPTFGMLAAARETPFRLL